ncbi:MAG: glutathione binding-like protein [Hyphomicrobiaceae bacterium]
MMKLKGDSTYIAGDKPSLADLYLLPQVTHLAATPDSEETQIRKKHGVVLTACRNGGQR